MPKSDVKALFAAFGGTGDAYKELADEHAGVDAQQTWPLLRSFAPQSHGEETARDNAPPDPLQDGQAEPSTADGDGAFPLLGNVRFNPAAGPAPRPRTEPPKRPAAAEKAQAGGALKQLFSRLATNGGRAQETGSPEMAVAEPPVRKEVLGAVFSRLSNQGVDGADSSSGADLFSRLRK